MGRMKKEDYEKLSQEEKDIEHARYDTEQFLIQAFNNFDDFAERMGFGKNAFEKMTLAQRVDMMKLLQQAKISYGQNSLLMFLYNNFGKDYTGMNTKPTVGQCSYIG